MATQAVSAEQLVISLNSDLLAQLQDSAARFGYESSEQAGAEVIERYLESWIASKEAGPTNGTARRVSTSGKASSEMELGATVSPPREQGAWTDWGDLYEQCIADMLADPALTDEQKQQLLREQEMSDEEWEPIQLPEGAEPLSVTIIKMRRGE